MLKLPTYMGVESVGDASPVDKPAGDVPLETGIFHLLLLRI